MNMVNALTNLRLSAIPIPLVVFAAVLGALFLFLAVPRIIAHGGPVEGQVIHACVNENSGEIKIVGSLGDGGSNSKDSNDSNDGCKKKQLELDWNAVGPQGATGATGPSGPAGDAGQGGLSGYVHLRSSGFDTNSINSEWVVIITCPTGKVAVGGGHSVGGSGWEQVRIIDNEPWPRQPLPNQWRVNARRVALTANIDPWTLYANVICIDSPDGGDGGDGGSEEESSKDSKG